MKLLLLFPDEIASKRVQQKSVLKLYTKNMVNKKFNPLCLTSVIRLCRGVCVCVCVTVVASTPLSPTPPLLVLVVLVGH